MELAFLTQELNLLNLKLQDPGQLITAAYDSAKATFAKLRVRKSQFSAETSVISQYTDLLWRTTILFFFNYFTV